MIATFRADSAGEPFAMFDFTPVGLSVALAGLVFIGFVGWRLITQRQNDERSELFEISDYLFEARIPPGSVAEGKTVAELETMSGAEFVLAAIVRGGRQIALRSSFEVLYAEDVLAIEAAGDALEVLVDSAGVDPAGSSEHAQELLGAGQVVLAEAVVMPDSTLRSQSIIGADLRRRFGVNLLAISRRGRQFRTRLRDTVIEAGDVLLLQAREDDLAETIRALGCLPLAERGLRIGARERRALLAVSIFGGALIVAAALRLLPIQIAVVGAAAIMGLVGLVSPKEIYESIDWTVIVLLGAMISVGGALEATGAAGSAADTLVTLLDGLPVWVMVAAVLVVSMSLSDLVNNTAAAVLMAPIALGVAHELAASPDPFLMAVAIGASAAFLTPIGHQSNLLVMGPAGYRFGDYWRMGLPLEALIAVVSVPMILLVWPS